MPLYLHKITATHFRNYDALRVDFAGAPAVVLTGQNGSGKTNILEAVSLLSPGRGLRGADLLDMKNRTAGPADMWAVTAEVETHRGEVFRIGTGLRARPGGDATPPGRQRVVRIDGRDARSQNDLAGISPCVWLTPQMDRLFVDGASARRRFLDKLVYACEPAHAATLNRHDRTQRERLKLLQLAGRADPAWLDGLEAQIAGDAVAIAASRTGFLARMASSVAALAARESLFPAPALSLSGWAEREIARRSALAAEDELRARLAGSRASDAAAGRSHEGAHRTDLQVFYAARDMMPAAQCSTGEQKALLVSLVLAHTQLMRAERGFAPLLLLDEVCAHLDEARRAQLLSFLAEAQGQVFLTGTDEGIFAGLSKDALFLRADRGRLAPRRKLEAI
jgi:DNA replication and repair protein RecF